MSPSSSQVRPSAVARGLRACLGAFASAGFFSFFINLLMLTGPLFMLQVYDRVLTSGSLPTLLVLFVLVVGLFAFMGILEWVRSRILVRIAVKLDESVKAEVFDAMVAHELRRTPDVQTGPVQDLRLLRSFIAGPGPAALFDMPWAPFYIAINFLFHWTLGVFSLVAALLLVVLSVINEMLGRRPVAAAALASGRADGLVQEARQNAEVLKVMGMLGNFRKRWMARDARARQFQTEASDRGGLIAAITKPARMLFQSSVLAIGAVLVIRQEITPGTMVVASIILSRALAPLEQGIAQWRNLLAARKAYQRLAQVTAPEAVAEALGEAGEDRMQLPAPKGVVRVARASVLAPGSEAVLLADVDFRLEPGGGLGIIGGSGAGKSTLLRLLTGLWRPDRGTVRLDGAELHHYPGEHLGRLIGYLPQNVGLFAATVQENIARLAPDADAEAVIKAARLAHVHDLIQQLPDGYNTQLGGDGLLLSAGQQQRIALARAFYGDPVLVVLDEPNAHLDAEGEAALVAALRHLRRSGTSVVVAAHRPSVIAAVSELLVLRQGRVMDFGPREEVLARVTVRPARGASMSAGQSGQKGQAGQGAHDGKASDGVAQQDAATPQAGAREEATS